MIYLIISVIVYGLSAYGMYRYIHIAHSKGGRWDKVAPDAYDTFTVFCPILNTLAILLGSLILPSKINVETKKEKRNKFFNIEK